MCEELALQPDLLRELDLNDIGINPENCELMFERGVVVFVGLVAIILVVRVRVSCISASSKHANVIIEHALRACRAIPSFFFGLPSYPKQLQFILSITNFHKQIPRQRMYGQDLNSDLALNVPGSVPYSDVIPIDDVAPRRIYLLATRTRTDSISSNASPSNAGTIAGDKNKERLIQTGLGDALVYAPVPIESLSADEARELASSGAWVASPQSSTFPDMHLPHRRHNRSQSRSSTLAMERGHSRTQSATDARNHGGRSAEGGRHTRSRSSSLGKGGHIALPTHPYEGLLPSYETSVAQDVKS